MKRFGSFKPLDAVVSSDILSKLHVAVSSVSELADEYPNNTIAVFTKADGIYSPGDVVVKKNGEWVKLKLQFPTLGPVTELRGYRLDKRVYLKYKSPADGCDNRGNKTVSWKKEIVVRKYGSEPTTELDGTVVRVITRKDLLHATASQYLVDYIPDADNEAKWYYKVFVQADNGTIDYSRTAPGITIYDMPWSNIIEAIRDGHASKIFSVGDAFKLDDGNELVIANITTKSPYRITMMLRYPKYELPFDAVKGEFKITRDKRIVARKNYYTLGPGGYSPVYRSNGAVISDILYENVGAAISTLGRAGRDTNGSNRWSTSDIRYWLNLTIAESVTEADKAFMRSFGGEITSEQFSDLTTVPDNIPLPPYLYLKKYIPDILGCLTTTTCTTAVPTVDGINTETTQDRFFIPSITELTGNKNNGRFSEGSQFAIYSSEIENNEHLLLPPDSNIPTNVVECFTRSPSLVSNEDGFGVVSSDGTDVLTAGDSHGILVAFNIG